MYEDFHTSTNPFPGLRPFEFDESHLFFGRDGQSEELISRLRRTRFLTLLGTSGSGKSSLLRAGLLPALAGGLMPGAGSHWRIAMLRPGNDPVGNLAHALNSPDVFDATPAADSPDSLSMMETTLRRGRLGLVEIAHQSGMSQHENLLVVVDQFEELFRFRAARATTDTDDDASAFVKLLLEAARQRDLAIYVVLTMRSDFLGDCTMFWGLPEAINEGHFSIPRLNRDECREAILGPVRVCGASMTTRLINRILNDVGDNPDQLPILQHALMRTWEMWREDQAEGEPVDLRHYVAIGTMSGALSRHADEAWNELPDERSRHIAELLFKALTERGPDNREIRRPTRLWEICEIAGASTEEVAAVVEVFRHGGRSFLMLIAGIPLNADMVIDIPHESLIRNWPRLNEWVYEESLSAQIYRRLAETAVLHEQGQAGLWRDPDLQLALDWRGRTRPTTAWAERYYSAFDSAMAFLDASVAARDAAALEEERRRRREIRRTRVTAVIFFFLFMLSLAAFVYAYIKSVRV